MTIRIYISGPMTGLPDLNFPAFHDAAELLKAAGYDVVNPATLNPDPATPWAQCMRVDIKALCDCDAVAVLPGWDKSRGAMLELDIARRLEMQIGTVGEWLARAMKAA